MVFKGEKFQVELLKKRQKHEFSKYVGCMIKEKNKQLDMYVED